MSVPSGAGRARYPGPGPGGRVADGEAPPTLAFACELGRDRLEAFFADGSVVRTLLGLRAGVVLALADLTPPRANVVRQLNAAGVPVTAVPLLPAADGYYFTAGRPSLAAARYRAWRAWARSERLAFAGVGLDIEPDVRLYQRIAERPLSVPAVLAARVVDRRGPALAARAYAGLVDEIRADGWTVENYQFPLIADERRARSAGLERIFGLVDVATDREVWMLYSSFLRRLGPGLIWSYGPEAAAMAVGSTGGGPDIPGHPQVAALTWQELVRDLRLASLWVDRIYVHSLEGCVEHGYLDRLADLDWSGGDRPRLAGAAAGLRLALQGSLWASSHPARLGLAAAGAVAGRALCRRGAGRAGGPDRGVSLRLRPSRRDALSP